MLQAPRVLVYLPFLGINHDAGEKTSVRQASLGSRRSQSGTVQKYASELLLSRFYSVHFIETRGIYLGLSMLLSLFLIY